MNNDDSTITLDEMNVIVKIPERAVALTITAVILENGEQVNVSKKMDVVEIRQARDDFLNNVEFGDDYDGVFVLSDEVKKQLEESDTDGCE